MPTPFFQSLTPPPTILKNPGDVGPWVSLPLGVGTAFVHIESIVGNPAGVGAACLDFSNTPGDGAPYLGAWTSQNLSGPGTGDGLQIVCAPRAMRLRLASTHASGVVITGTINSNG